MRVVKKIVYSFLTCIILTLLSLNSYLYLSRTPISFNTSDWPQQNNVKAVTRGNVTLWTEHFGDPKNPAILLLHGAGSRSTAWPEWFLSSLVNANYFVIRYDQRDAGYSTHFWQTVPYARGPYAMQDLCEDAWAVLDAYHIKKTHYIGYSMGGYLVSTMLYKKPERALSSVIIAAGVTELDSLRKKLGISSRNKATNNYLGSNSPTGDLNKDFAMWLEYFSYLHGCYRMNIKRVKEFIESSYTRNPRDLKTPWNHISVVINLSEEHVKNLKTITTPCLILHGSEDKLIPIDNGKKLAELIPTAQFIELPGVSHHLFSKAIWDKIGKEVLTFFLNTN